MSNWKDSVDQIRSMVENHHTFRRSCLNMVAAENVTSPMVEHIVGSDFSRRYSSPGVYAGDTYFLPAYELALSLLRTLFHVEYINIKPATGNLTVIAIVTALAKPGDTIMKVADDHGGYPIRLAKWAGIEILPLPFDFDRLNVCTEKACEQIRKVRPKLVLLGASEFLYPHPVRELAQAAHEVGAVLAYDGSHVMGLIAGSQFQDPITEGADVLYGSTHKTFPGPQRGMIATNNREIMERIGEVLSPPPFLLSCYHLNSTVALGIAATEMLAFGKDYANQIVRNSQALAHGLLNQGVPIFTSKYGCSQSHQVILDNGGFVSPLGVQYKQRMEACGILADAVVRIGTQEQTRLGMGESEMHQVAKLIADAILERRPQAEIRSDVRDMARRFQTLHFSFEEEKACYDFMAQRVKS
jgi:glycine hydroxymethyltransferase